MAREACKHNFKLATKCEWNWREVDKTSHCKYEAEYPQSYMVQTDDGGIEGVQPAHATYLHDDKDIEHWSFWF